MCGGGANNNNATASNCAPPPRTPIEHGGLKQSYGSVSTTAAEAPRNTAKYWFEPLRSAPDQAASWPSSCVWNSRSQLSNCWPNGRSAFSEPIRGRISVLIAELTRGPSGKVGKSLPNYYRCVVPTSGSNIYVGRPAVASLSALLLPLRLLRLLLLPSSASSSSRSAWRLQRPASGQCLE